MRAFRHRDFRIFWGGALFSFTGGWVQNVAQGWLVYDLTNNKAMLALVAFCNALPVALFAFFAGILADKLDKRKALVACQTLFGLSALYLAAATYYEFVSFWQILVVSTITGIVGAIEFPMRQSSVSRMVPRHDLSSAIPLQAMTFNLARILGPAVGGLMLAEFGAATCYLINGLSYLALILAVLAIRADLRAVPSPAEPVLKMVKDGVRHMWSDRRLQALFLLEGAVSFLALPYITFIPAIARDQLRLDERGLGLMYTMIGIGAVSALVFVSTLKTDLQRATAILVAMPTLAIGLFFFAITQSPVVAYPLLTLMGMCTVMQFNSTNTLFQMLAPEAMRGRLLSLHQWALSGVGPFGTLLAGPTAAQFGLAPVFQGCAVVLLAVAVWGWSRRKEFRPAPEATDA